MLPALWRQMRVFGLYLVQPCKCEAYRIHLPLFPLFIYLFLGNGARRISWQAITDTNDSSPLFTTPMYNNLGIHWASSIPAFLALLCLPFPFVFHRYGLQIRKRCRYSADAMRITEELRTKQSQGGHNTEKSMT